MKLVLEQTLKTFKAVLSKSSLLTTVILSVVLYSFFYPTAYKAERPERLPIVIVDEEQSPLTASIIREVGISPNVEIKAIQPEFSSAERMLRNQQVDAILYLPETLSASLRRGEPGGVGIYLSAAYLLKTKQIGIGLAGAVEASLQDNIQQFTQLTHFSFQIPIHSVPLFNPLSGYGSYIFPAVATLIIHQTLILGLGMLIGGYRQAGWYASSAEFWGIFLCFLIIGCLGCYYLYGFTFWLYDYPRGGNFVGMLISVPVFISCVVALGMLFGSLLTRSDRSGYYLVATSVPLFLISGIAWPIQSMPLWLQAISLSLPSTHAIHMFIQLNQIGAPLVLVLPKLIGLSIASIVLLALAYFRLTSTKYRVPQNNKSTPNNY